MTPTEHAGMIFTLVAVGLALWHFVVKPRKPKPGTSEGCAQYIAEMRSHLRRQAARKAATQVLQTGARRG